MSLLDFVILFVVAFIAWLSGVIFAGFHERRAARLAVTLNLTATSLENAGLIEVRRRIISQINHSPPDACAQDVRLTDAESALALEFELAHPLSNRIVRWDRIIQRTRRFNLRCTLCFGQIFFGEQRRTFKFSGPYENTGTEHYCFRCVRAQSKHVAGEPDVLALRASRHSKAAPLE